MTKIGSMLAAGAIALGGWSCGNMKMPKISMPEMPEMLKADKPEVKVQKQIAVVVKADSEIRFYKEVAELLDVAHGVGWDGRRLAGEVLGYSEKVEGEQGRGKYFQLVEALRIPRMTMADVAASRLEAGEGNGEVNRLVLKSATPPEVGGEADFSALHAYLEVRKGQLPEKVVVWMYQRDAGAAMREMMRLYGAGLAAEEAREILIGERVVDQMAWKQRSGLARANEADALAAEEVAKMAGSKQWWVRAYAAAVMEKWPVVRKADVMAKLAKDENGVVRGVAVGITK